MSFQVAPPFLRKQQVAALKDDIICTSPKRRLGIKINERMHSATYRAGVWPYSESISPNY